MTNITPQRHYLIIKMFIQSHFTIAELCIIRVHPVFGQASDDKKLVKVMVQNKHDICNTPLN